MSEAARSRWEGTRYEPQATTPSREGSTDPLAELARLVGQEDPFRTVFRQDPATDRPRPVSAAPRSVQDVQHAGVPGAAAVDHEASEDHPRGYDDRGDGGHWHRPDHDHHGQPAPDGGHGYDDQGYDGQGYDDPGADGYDAHHYADDQHAHADEAGIADEHLAAEDAAVGTIPDLWARGGNVAQDGVPSSDAGSAPHPADAGERSSARRPLAVLAAVLVLTGGGLAASFLAKGPATSGPSSANSARTAPTIMAANGPTKVKAEDASATAPEDRDATLLNKSGNPSSGPVKIVSSQEQPADLSLLPKTSDLAEGAKPLPPAAPSPFPEPKRVKTFVVHPDGSMLTADGAPPDAAAGTTAGSDPSVAALPSTPKTAARGGTTPRSAPTTVAALAADPPEAAPRQPASPGVRAATKPNDAADTPATGSGGYGLQLASSPVEADAQAAFARMKKKYPSLLGSLAPSIHRAETGDKPVYRVRVGGMSQDEAKALCSKLQGAGGSCFVVHN